MKKVLSLFMIVALLIPCTGCWDRVEIDRRDIISTIGIDIGEDVGKNVKEKKPTDPFPTTNLKRLKVTYGFPDTSKISVDKGNAAPEKYFTSEGYSFEDAVVKNTAKSSRRLTNGMERIVILSEDIFKYEDVLRDALDYLVRSNAVNKSMYVVVCEGRPEDYINFQPSTESNLENFISGLMNNAERDASIIPVRFNEFIISLNKNGNAIVPKIKYDAVKNEVSLIGSALIRKYKIIEELNYTESANIRILKGTKGTISKAIFYKGNPVDFVIKRTTSKIKADTKNPDKIIFNINIVLDGEVSDYYFGEKVGTVPTLNEVQKDFNESISRECARTMKFKLQDKALDFVGLRENLEAYHSPTWNRIKENWDKAYINSEINITVSSRIRRVGLVK